VACLFNGPDATPPADLALHIGELGGSEVTTPFHKPSYFSHQINDCLIVMPILDPLAKA
jgi:hypothetical protein